MKTIDRSIQIITIAELYELYLLKRFENIVVPEHVDEEKQKHLIDGILANLPVPALMIKYTTSRNYGRELIQGKEFVETILYFILNHNNPHPVGIDCFDKRQKETFWHFSIPTYYFSENLTSEEIREIVSYHASI